MEAIVRHEVMSVVKMKNVALGNVSNDGVSAAKGAVELVSCMKTQKLKKGQECKRNSRKVTRSSLGMQRHDPSIETG